MLSKENIQDVYNLAPMQLGMLLHHARNEDTTSYIEQFDFVIEGSIDKEALATAFNRVIQKYAVIRTVFSFRKTDIPRQVVLKSRQADIEIMTIDGDREEDLQRQVEAYKATDKAKGFDLSRDLLARISLVLRPDNMTHVIFTFHHIILDGWCLGLLFRDLFSFYEAALNRVSDDIPPPQELIETQAYSNFITWLEAQEQSSAREWWRNYLQDYSRPVGIPWFDVPHSGQTPKPATYRFELDAATTEKLRSVANQYQVTFNALFQTAWGILLQKLNNTNDVVFGSVVSGRPADLPCVEDIVGLFINTVPVRVRSTEGKCFHQLAQEVNEKIFSSSAYEYFPLYEIQQFTELKDRLINHVVAFENYPIDEQMKSIGKHSSSIKIRDVKIEEHTNYDFNLIINPGNTTRICFSYNEVRFDKEVMLTLRRSLETLLHAISDRPYEPLANLSICSEEDRRRIEEQFNSTTTAYPREATIPELFYQAVENHPDSIAISSQDRKITYRELQRDANRFAHTLIDQGIKPGSRLALYLPRSPEVVIAILGSLSVGACYVPLDTELPAERLQFILDDANVDLLVATEKNVLPINPSVPVLNVESLIRQTKDDNVQQRCQPTSAAYVMYTSGSTGQAKGCVIMHRNIIRLVKNTNYINLDHRQVILSSSSPVFDASTLEYWGSLLNGATLCLYDNHDLLDPNKLKTILKSESVTTMWLTSALFNQLVETDISLFESLQQLLVGGEVLSQATTGKFVQKFPHIALINGYGPTENTTFSATYRLREVPNFRVPIGKPIANSTCYIVDSAMQLLPPGAYGELCVGGDGVSEGYINRDALNAQMFVHDLFAPGRYYRTGDIARWMPDGNIDLLGRVDFQHKIRGYRVELGEIEHAIVSHPGVQHAVVQVVDTTGGKQLHAWFVSDTPACDENQVRTTLMQKLPRYMVPEFLLRMEEFPLNINGKIDRKALPPITLPATRARDVVLPANEHEKIIADVCTEILGLSQLSVYDNFFELGANSINLITINNRLKKILDKDIPITAMFEHTNVRKLAEYLSPNDDEIKIREEQENASMESAKSHLMKAKKMKRMAETI